MLYILKNNRLFSYNSLLAGMPAYVAGKVAQNEIMGE